jgi:C-terminal processing protease CtpA/Prc
MNMAGLFLEQDRDDFYFVRHVAEGSPASEKGLKAGDRITSINGVDVRKYSYREVLDIFNGAGRLVRLTLERGSERLKIKLTLKRLI